MKKIIFRSFLAVLILGGPAIAADMPIKARVPAAASYNWSGFYIGGNVGYGWRGDRSGDLTTPTPGVPATGDVVPFPGTSFRTSGNSSGLLGGVQLGYNVQAPGSAFVMGVEADWQLANFGRGSGPDTGFARALPTFNTPGLGISSNGGAASNIFFFDGNNRTDWFATVRGRVGVAWDRTLLYATGGLAIRDNRGGGGITNGGALPATFFANVDGAAAAAGVTASGVGRNNFGGAVGGGIEHAFSNNLSVKVEGLWLLFGGNTSGRVVGVTNMGAPINTSSSDNDLGIVRVGLNWKLGGL